MAIEVKEEEKKDNLKALNETFVPARIEMRARMKKRIQNCLA